jgi:hypothetical protein
LLQTAVKASVYSSKADILSFVKPPAHKIAQFCF